MTLAVIAIGLSCGRAVDQVYVGFQLIEENQTRCYDLANKVSTIWSENIGSDLPIERALVQFYQEDGLEALATTSAAKAEIYAVVSEFDQSEVSESNSLLLEAYSLNQAICDLATNPSGRSLLTFNERKSELQDDYAAVSSKLELFIEEPSGTTVLALDHHRSMIDMAKMAVVAERVRKEAERLELERVRKQVMREASLRRREAEKETRAQDNERRLADASVQERRQLQEEEAQRLLDEELRRKEEETQGLIAEERRRKEIEEQEQRERAAALRSRRIKSEMQRWHPTYSEAMEPLRTTVGQVMDAWSRPNADAKPYCRRLRREISRLNRSALLGSPNVGLNSRLEAMLDGFDETADLCLSGARFGAEARLKDAVKQWGEAGTILRSYSLQP